MRRDRVVAPAGEPWPASHKAGNPNLRLSFGAVNKLALAGEVGA